MRPVSQAQSQLFGTALAHKQGTADLRGLTRDVRDKVIELSKLDKAKLEEVVNVKTSRLPTRRASHPGMQRKVRSV